MIIKKIQLKFKSGYLTPLESDTILWYIFAKNFLELESVFNKYKQWDIPFKISNGFINWNISRPIIFGDNKHDKSSLLADLIIEKDKKLLKSLSYVPLKKEILKAIFEDQDKIPDILKTMNESNVEIECLSSEMKNSIPRFNQWETTPFVVNDIRYSTSEYNIYVKIYDEKDFSKFFELMQKTLLALWRWKWVSRWYGKVSTCELKDLTDQESEAFKYLEQLKSKNQIVVLNNYKPDNTEIENINLEKSYLQFINKNTKTKERNVFKWNMKFIAPGSVLYVKDWELKGSYYQVWTSFNFWYIF